MVVDEHKNWKMDKKSVELEFARNSLREELEAVNNYEARAAETEDSELKRILIHNMDEEKEHVAMLVEWIRKNDATQDKVFKEHD
jgi:hypothetical protein